jgi:hypothetical protein
MISSQSFLKAKWLKVNISLKSQMDSRRYLQMIRKTLGWSFLSAVTEDIAEAIAHRTTLGNLSEPSQSKVKDCRDPYIVKRFKNERMNE